jgi:hypothetical protein
MPGRSPAARESRSWGWFVLWTAVGALATLASLSLQILVAPLVVVVVLVLIVRGTVSRDACGLLAGAGLVSLFVAYVQRQGPGVVTWHTATASEADQYMDPRPWLIAGVIMVTAGILAFTWRRRSPA